MGKKLLVFGICITSLFHSNFAADWPHTGKYGFGTRYVYVYNNLQRDIWVFFKAHTDPTMPSDSFPLAAGENTLYELPNHWNSGQCYATFDINFQKPFVTLAEWTLGAPDSRADFYDISLVDAFSVPILLGPIEGTFTRRQGLPPEEQKYDCGTAICSTNALLQCPDYLQWKNDNGEIIACLGGCQAAARGRVDQSLREWYCCEPPNHNLPENCPTNPIASWFKERNPDAYSYPYDDHTSTYVCVLNPDNGVGPDYFLVFGSDIPTSGKGFSSNHAYAAKMTSLRMKNNNQIHYTIKDLPEKRLYLSMYTCSGKLIASEAVKNNQGIFRPGNVHKGVYVMVLKTDHILQSQRIIISGKSSTIRHTHQ